MKSVLIGNLQSRREASDRVGEMAAKRALERQAGQPDHPSPWPNAISAAQAEFATAATPVLLSGADPKSWIAAHDALPVLEAEELGSWLAARPWLHGGEHEVWFVEELRLAVKLTRPGEYGAEGLGLKGYARRLAWSNELFEDDMRILGQVHLPGEVAPRVVTTQPWCRADGLAAVSPHPTQREIDLCMRARGFLKAYDGAYLHESRDIVASDGLPKNFIRDAAGHIHPVDLILIEPSARQYDRLQAMVASQTQG